MRNDTPRQIVRSRTTMSYAFEASVMGLVTDIRAGRPIGPLRRDRGRMIASAVEAAKSRKVPTWTVSKKERHR